MSGMATSSRSVGDVVPRGSVGAFLEARKRLGFDVTTETCHVLADMLPLPIAQWQEGSELYNMIYDVLGRNEILSGRSAKGTHVNKWTHKFTKFARTWKELLKGSPMEILSRIVSGLPFYELPLGSMPVEEWCKAHVPSVL